MLTKDTRKVPTICPFCGVGCNLDLHIQDNFIFKVTSPFESIVNKGNLCVKGRFGYDFIYNKRRVTTPLIRKHPQKPGQRTQAFDRSEWSETSWEEALEYTANRLVEIYQSGGSDAMAVYCCAKATNEDNYLLQKMYRVLFRTNNIDHCTRLCHAASVVGLQKALGSAAMSNTAAEVADTDVFIITGSNTTETHPIIAIQMIAAVEKHGAKIIVVDPRRVEMVNHAALWLAERPGSDVAVFSGMAHVIIKEELYNRNFIEDRTENFEQFCRSMEKFTPEYAESISGVNRDTIIQAARMYANANRAAIYWTLGISQSTHGTDNTLSLINLALLTGHIGKHGTGLNPLRGQNNVQGASDSGAMPWHYPGYQEVEDEETVQKFEKMWLIEHGGLNRIKGLSTTEILANVGKDGIRSLYIMGENPMMSEPNLNEAHLHMQNLEFVVAQDLFINESAAYADVFLPAVSFAEKNGTFTNTDRRVQLVRKAMTPLGNSRADWEIIGDLATRIAEKIGRNQSSGWIYNHPSEIFKEMGQLVPSYRGITYDRIDRVGLQTPVPNEDHPGTPFLFEESFPRGRGKFHPLDFRSINEETDEEYPYLLNTGRLLEHWHGGTLTRNSWLDDLYPEGYVEIHPSDAQKLEINDLQAVKVTSRRGNVILRAKVTEKTIPGVFFIPFHFAEAAANMLTNDAMDPEAKIPEFKACSVKIKKVDLTDLPFPNVLQQRGRY
ncbi:MAG: formate dehydrogenase subunit alpha [Chloroflexi bacterium HGW-Chloroflexi-10]|nr:MAG: formate dehydrogenase subunit alpha [Chloroflexi bacterium HGW-Chloroflexi-10]